MQTKIIDLKFRFQSAGQNVLRGLNAGVNNATKSFNNLSKAAGTNLKNSVDAVGNSARNFGTATASAARNAAQVANVTGRASKAFDDLGTKLSISREEFLAQNAAVKAYNKSLEQSSSVANALQAANLAAQAQGVTPQEAKEIAKRAQDFTNSTKDATRDVFNLTKGLKGLSSGDALGAFRGLISLTKVFRSGLGGALITIGGFASAITGLVTAISGLGAAAVAVTRDLREFVQRTGIAAEDAASLGFQLSQIVVNAQLQDLQEAILNISERFGEASKDAGAIRDSFIALGFTIDEVIDFSFKGPVEQFERFRAAIRSTANASDALFRARELGAEDLARILPLLTASTAELEEVQARRDFLFIGDQEEQVKTINEIQFAGAELGSVLANITAASATAFGPALVNGTKAFAAALSVAAKAVGFLLTPLVKLVNVTASYLAVVTELAAFMGNDWINSFNLARQAASQGFFSRDAVENTNKSIRDSAPSINREVTFLGIAAALKMWQSFVLGIDNTAVVEEAIQGKINQFQKLIEEQELSGNTERLVELQDIFKEISSNTDLADQLNNFNEFFRTGQSTTILPEVQKELKNLSQIATATSESAAKISPSFAVDQDTSQLVEIQKNLETYEKGLEAFRKRNEERITNLVSLGATEEQIQFATKAIETTEKAYIDAINRINSEARLFFLEQDFNRETIAKQALASFDTNAEQELALARDIFQIKRDFGDKLEDTELNAVLARRRAFQAEVVDRENALQRLQQRNSALNISAITDFDSGDAVNEINALASLSETVQTEIAEVAKALFEGSIDESTFAQLNFQITELEKFLIEETKNVVAANKRALRNESLDFSELFEEDFADVTNFNAALSDITETVRESRARLFNAELNGAINIDERTAALNRLASAENAALARARESEVFNNEQLNFQARDLSSILRFDTSSVVDAERAINDLSVLIRNKSLEIESRLRLGRVDPEEANRLLNEAEQLGAEVQARINSAASRNLQNNVNRLTQLDNFFKLDGDTTLATIDEVTRSINEAANKQATDILDFIFINRKVLSDALVADLEAALLELRQRAANAISSSNDIAERNQVPINLTSSLFSGERPDLSSLGIADDSFIQDIVALGDSFRTNVLDNIGLIRGDDTLRLKFPELDVDLSSINSARDGLNRINAARIAAIDSSNEQVRLELRAQNVTDINVIKEEQEKREEEINRFASELAQKEIPLQLGIKFVTDITDAAGSIFNSINTLQQNSIDNIQQSISNRAEEITETQDRLRQAIEIGDVNEVRNAQARLNGLVDVQKREDALARERFENNKKTQKALAVVSIAGGAAQALGKGIPGLFLMGAILAAGKAQLDAIDRAQFQSVSGLGGAGSFSGGDLGNSTDLNNLSGGLTAEQLIERGRDDDDRRPRDVNLRITLPNEGLMSPQQVRALFEEANELSGDGQINNFIIQN